MIVQRGMSSQTNNYGPQDLSDTDIRPLVVENVCVTHVFFYFASPLVSCAFFLLELTIDRMCIPQFRVSETHQVCCFLLLNRC